jgi:hypothetical protein
VTELGQVYGVAPLALGQAERITGWYQRGLLTKEIVGLIPVREAGLLKAVVPESRRILMDAWARRRSHALALHNASIVIQRI